MRHTAPFEFASTTANNWTEKAARAGHFAKGVVYGLIGLLALQAAFGAGGSISGGKEAVQYISGQPFGLFLLIAVGVGLAGYALWRCLMAVKDTEGDGRDAKGLAKRAGYIASAVLNGALAVVAFQLALGSGSSNGETKTWLFSIMSGLAGRILVGALGVAVVCTGLYQFRQAYKKLFMRKLKTHEMSSQVRRITTRLGQVGYAARGVVFPIVGAGLITAAVNHNPNEATGIEGALYEIASTTYGMLLLAVVAAGLLAYGVFMIASARYRRIQT